MSNKIKMLEDALRAYLENPHCATTIADGKHASCGFCKTCADQYFVANGAILAGAGIDIDAYERGMRDGVALAETHAEVSERDAWTRVAPYIDWSYVRKKLEEVISNKKASKT